MGGSEQAQMRARRKANRKMKTKLDDHDPASAKKKQKVNHASPVRLSPRKGSATGGDASTSREPHDGNPPAKATRLEKKRRSFIIPESKQKPPDHDDPPAKATMEKKKQRTGAAATTVTAIVGEEDDVAAAAAAAIPTSKYSQPLEHYYSSEDEESRELDRSLGRCMELMALQEAEEKKRVEDLFSRDGPKALIEKLMVSFRDNILKIEQESLALHRRLEAQFLSASEECRQYLMRVWHLDVVRDFLNIPVAIRPPMWEHPNCKFRVIARIAGDDPLNNPYRCLHMKVDPETGFNISSFFREFSRSKIYDRVQRDFHHQLFLHFKSFKGKITRLFLFSKGEEFVDNFNKKLSDDLKITKKDLELAVSDFVRIMPYHQVRSKAHNALIRCVFEGGDVERWICEAFDDYSLHKFVDSLRTRTCTLSQECIMQKINRYYHDKCDEDSGCTMTIGKYLKLKLHYAELFGF